MTEPIRIEPWATAFWCVMRPMWMRAVLSRYQAGETVAALAADYGLPVDAVAAICTREDCWPLMDKARAKAGKRGRL